MILQHFPKNNNGNINKQIYGSLLIIISYLLDNNFDEKQNISEIRFPNYLRIDSRFIEFLEDKGKDLKAEKIFGIFLFFEHLCFNDLCKTLQNEYKEEISNEINEKIENNFLNNGDVNDIISIKEFGTAIRRFISRFLVGNKTEDKINPNSLLLFQLKRPDLWEEKIRRLQNLDELISNKIQELNLTVGQSFKFYEKIKFEDEKEILIDEEDNDNDEKYILPRMHNTRVRRKIN